METLRTILRKPNASDYEQVFQLQSDERSRQFLGGPVTPEGFSDKFTAILQARSPESYWVVRQKETDAFIGLVCIALYHDRVHYEVSYELHPAFWGEGYGTEIVERVIHHGFDVLRLEEIYAETQKKNLASRRLLEKVGMQLLSERTRFEEEQCVYVIRQ